MSRERKRRREERKRGLYITPANSPNATPDGSPQKYAAELMAKQMEALREGTMKPGQVYTIGVAHDDWCDLLHDRGPCNCDPEVRAPERVPNLDEN
jgi:hypothetical protein